MTEGEWLACTDPVPMLEFLRGKGSGRKLRLFAAASFGRLVALLPDPRQRRGIEVLERLAEGTVTLAGCRGVAAEVRRAIPPDDWIPGTPPADHPHYIALMLYREFCSSSIAVHAVHASSGRADGVGEHHEQVRLMRCIFGNPFRPVALEPAWLTPIVFSLARAAYDERVMPEGTLNPARLAVLADALEDTGCTNQDVFGHLRGPGTHVRGCWVVDLILGKE
jgi:hypothetical protein